MKYLKIILVAVMLLANLAWAQPSLADPPKLTTSSDYTEVTQAIQELLQAKAAPEQSGYTPAEIEQKLSDLQLQKYILETASSWGVCRNETGLNLGIYANKPGKKSASPTALYFLAAGEETDDEWDCDGVYLPTGSLVALNPNDPQPQELVEPLAIKVVNGTKLLVKTNADTGVIELNVPPAKVFKAGEIDWLIPALTQAEIDATATNAPVD